VHLHYFDDEGYAYGHWIEYVISNVFLGYCIVELNEMKVV
jgi:hypothetical protein